MTPVMKGDKIVSVFVKKDGKWNLQAMVYKITPTNVVTSRGTFKRKDVTVPPEFRDII